MSSHSSATLRKTSHVTTIDDSLRQRSQSVIHNTSIDERWRAVIRYGMETNDPWLADLVGRVEAGESIEDTFESTR